MKILANKRIKALFSRILMCILVFAVVAAVFMNVTAQNTAVSIYLSSLCMAVAILIFCYAYFKEQHVIIETAAEQITDYIAGDPDARIQCDEEGELYRLFQEVNSLVSILNAHAENELRAKEFLKNTIADISHQLKRRSRRLMCIMAFYRVKLGIHKRFRNLQVFRNKNWKG